MAGSPESKQAGFVSDGLEVDLHKVRIFGCSDCSLLIFHFSNTVQVDCPYCSKKIDVFAEYEKVAFASGIFMTLFGTEVQKIAMDFIEATLAEGKDDEKVN